jgi:triose/dihydroxyacetone kinase / FAD-AMP lyase (cyclizing)
VEPHHSILLLDCRFHASILSLTAQSLPAIRHSPSKSVYISYSANEPVSRATVAVISGGGAGHEPAHAGYTGFGMLAASVSGDIFASPSAKQILQTIGLASSSGATSSLVAERPGLKDVLVIINNYTGDRLNFGLAIEKALASSPIHIESVVVADDVSLLRSPSDSNSRSTLVGARGLAGNILVCKILSALAERGESLARVKQLGDAVVRSLASVGVGLDHCHVPGRAPWGSGEGEGMRLGEHECEIGLGLHNEPGVTRKKMEGPTAVIREMLELIIHSRDHGEDKFLTMSMNGELGDEVVVFVNNLGGISQLEMGAVLDEILVQLGEIRFVFASQSISWP